MCTVSIVPHANGYRLVCNRDEQRTRDAATPPAVRRTGERLAAYPIDPVGGGTWLGVNDGGLAVALLNRTHGHRATQNRQSRGLIVPTLLAHRSMAEACEAALSVRASAFNPFQVVLVQHTRCCAVTSDGSALRDEWSDLTSPLLFTSSSLGDDVVDAPRRQLFSRLVLERIDAPLHGQARFHRHHWPTRPEISVRMARRDAATVSRTVVDVTSSGQRVLYQPLDGAAEGSREWCFFR